MAPYGLVGLGFVLLYFNHNGHHIGFRGLPWLDAPSTLIGLGILFGVIQYRFKKAARERAAALEEARQALEETRRSQEGP